MDGSTPGFPVLHQLPELAQTHVHVWWHPTSSSSVIPFSSCLQSCPSSGSFPMSLFASGGQRIGASASASILAMNIQGWFSKIDWFDLLAVQRTLKESSPTPRFKSINSLVLSFLCGPTLTSIHDYWKNHSFDYMDLCRQSDVCVFNTLCRFAIAFLPRSKHLLISWLQSPSAVILEPKKLKSIARYLGPIVLSLMWSLYNLKICWEAVHHSKCFIGTDSFNPYNCPIKKAWWVCIQGWRTWVTEM